MNDSIQNVDEAKLEAFRWAAQNGADAPRMVALAAEWFVKQQMPVTAMDLAINLQYFNTCVNSAANIWELHAHDSAKIASDWSMETVKHLAIINVAGVAGAAALLAMPNGLEGNGIKIALAAFLSGILFAVLTLWLMTRGNAARGMGAIARAKAIKESASWDSYVAAVGQPYKDAGMAWFRFSEAAGWISAAAAIIGGTSICIALFGA